jgi:ParB family transcriptional regulator, chromosome partitioning protein
VGSRVSGITNAFSSHAQIAEVEQQLEGAQQKISELEALNQKLQKLVGEGVSKSDRLETNLSIQSIVRDPLQARKYFDPIKLASLTKSIEELGVKERLWVRPLKEDKYQLVAGERRLRAAIEAGLSKVPVVILEIDEQLAVQLSLVENLQREDLNPLEETEGILQLLSFRLKLSMDEVVSVLYKMRNQEEGRSGKNVFPKDESLVVREIFDSLGRLSWQSFVSARLPLRNLPIDVLEALRSGQIEYTKARAIARVKDNEARLQLIKEASSGELSLSEINEKIELLKPKKPLSLKDEFKQLIKSNSKGWNDPQKTKKINSLLNQLKALVNED